MSRPRKYPAIQRDHKVCTKCAIEQPISQFPPNRETTDGLASWCHACHRLAEAQWRAKHAEMKRERNRRYWQKTTPEQRQRANDRRRQYLRDHPEKQREYYRTRRAKLLAQRAAEHDT